MASITLAGTLLDPNSDLSVGDELRFTHDSTTGQTLKGAVSKLIIGQDGAYSLPLQYGLVLVEYRDKRSTQFKTLGVATVNGDNPATTIPELLNALVPVSSAELIEFQAILADAVTAKNEAVTAKNASVTAEAGAVTARDVAVAASIIQYQTFAELLAISETVDYKQFTVAERANAAYTLQPAGYVALAGDATLANGRVAALQMSDGINVNWFATWQDANDRTAIIGGEISVPAGAYSVDQVLLDANVIFSGAGTDSTLVNQPNASNKAIFKTRNFDTLTGTNTWFVSGGVPVGFGVNNMTLNGNKENNASGLGLQFYGKKYFVHDLYIIDCVNDGFYTECASIGGQETYLDAPECFINNVWIRNCGGNGLTYRGPHDGVIGNLYPFLCGAVGASFETLADTYDGAADIGYVHTYANNIGMSNNSRINVEYIQTESNYAEGYICQNSDSTVGQLRAFKNQRDSEGGTAPVSSKNVDIQAACKISTAKVRTDNGGVGISITGDGTYIGYSEINGEENGSVGIDIDANQVIATSRIYDFTIGIALRCGATGATNGNFTTSTTRSSLTHFSNVTAGAAGELYIDMFTSAGETAISGVIPTSTESFNVVSRGDTVGQTETKGTSSITIGATSAVVSHGLLYTPFTASIQVTPTSNLNGANYWVSAVGATTFQINISTISDTTEFFSWNAKT